MSTSGYFKYRNAWRFDGPPHQERQLQENECKALLEQGGLLVRNTYDFDYPEPTPFWYVVKDRYGGLEELSPRVRNKIRHAFRFFEYRKVTYEELTERVFPILEETFAHYKVHDRNMDREVFSKYLEQCRQKRFDYWGIFAKDTGRMVGFCTVNDWGDCCEYQYTGVESRYLKGGYYPYYGLYHHLNGHYLETLGYRYVDDGTRSITEHSQIHEYLIGNFKFRKAYCRLEIRYNWWMKFAVKVLYPFRKIMPIPQVRAILNMESMAR